MDKTISLTIKNLYVSIEDKTILHGIDLIIKSRELHVVMGPNGSGKSTLTYALMGHPNYKFKDQSSKIKVNNTLINTLAPHERAKLGLMLAFQNPLAVPGVTLGSFLRTAYRELYKNEKIDLISLHRQIQQTAKDLRLDEAFLKRAINDGFSGGEKKKAEMLQLITLKPKFAIFDEIDTGLDVDALKSVANGIELLQKQGTGILLITHYQRILNYLKPTHVHIMKSGKLVKSGGAELVKIVEAKGYADF
ncbi:MAG: FeS assembly ATPase SufC [Candidatus Gottesmanbacteria bacterium GW2011_GWC1_43_10]|nr:MAG: FeS assembly ATPase SufC [Candidatus Gottesmanbacteria bacterium GW2011_GWA2_42_16]KKS54279.1 MAG: FeS assembly ATPase SufC [Candidatus Gottesmanbacteria bacterium GW2011_GWA1_42_26]KKS81315.1 MAG: FeS assembly ATPase SufC [Candidatus Gottesmanbacteria bacterium GW2011_GWC1_43_10]OGG09342.1 MAG: Fe-S cluster assembly ATPase SufC [Candidatus Gottesmanbacteria bacterium RIFCSPHIGHO2_01_FULL_43_15]